MTSVYNIVRPIRIQRKRERGWRMPPGTIYVGRPTKWANPFRVGGYFMLGDPDEKTGWMSMSWCEASPPFADHRFTKILTPDQAVEWYERLVKKYPLRDIGHLRGRNLACWCPLDHACHGDTLLRLANG